MIFLLESVIITVSNKRIPFRFIDSRKKFPDSFTNIFEILDVIEFGWINFFVFNVIGRTDKRLLDAIRVRRKILQRAVKRNRIKVL